MKEIQEVNKNIMECSVNHQ